MRYVIVTTVGGEAGKFNNKLRAEVLERFGVKSSKLPAHITLKAPFEYEGDIKEIEETISKFAASEAKIKYEVKGFSNFDDRVIYMDVIDNSELRKLHKRFVKEISKINYINFGNKEGENAIFHITVSSKKLALKFKEVWEFVNQRKCDFIAEYDNISIYIWRNNTWELYKRYELIK